MPTLADLVAAYTRTPTATVRLNGKRWRAINSLSFSQRFGESVATGAVDGRNPPTTPRVGMSISWTWGYNGHEVAGFTGEVSDTGNSSYPNRWKLQVRDVLWRADKAEQVLQTSPLNEILASAAVRYLLTHYGGISSSRISIPTLPASGSAWAGSEWKLGILTPVQWGDTDTNSGGTTALKAAAEICVCLGYWLFATPGGTITAKQMERKPSPTAREVFRRAINLLIQGAPERQASYEAVYNQVTVRGANTGVDGAQLLDQRQTSHDLLPSGVYRNRDFSSILLEYENASDAGAASVTSVTTRILQVLSRVPDVVPLRAKADPNRKVGDTVGLIDTGVALSSQKNYFIYAIDREINLDTGQFDDRITLDGGVGSKGYTTIPPPDASFSWRLMAETLDADAVVEVWLDGSGSSSPTGEIVSWAWSTSTTTYASSPNTASGEHAVFVFLASEGTADITLTVTDTTSKTGTFESTIDLTGADTQPPIQRVLSVAFGAAWSITPDGGATWASETTNGDAIAVGTIGAGVDDRAALDSAATYGLVATRGGAGAGGLRQTLDDLATASTNLVTNAAAITSNIWVNEANPARVWFAIGTAVYRSIDGGATKTAMAAAPATVHWIMEDPALDNSVFLLAGANMYNATAPTIGWALLYEGPVGAIARQFVRSRDGQVTWICYTGAPSGEAAQRVETGAAADVAVTDIRTIALDNEATNLLATLYLIDADDPAKLYSVDGLTGLSTVTSAETLPSGATAMHMLSDPDEDLAYIADFDSVALGTGAVRKWLYPPADLLYLMKAGDTGQQAHMLGFGPPVSRVAIELLVPTFGATGGGVWHYTSTNGWVLKNTGLPADKYWYRVVANGKDANEWILAGGSTNACAVSSSGLMADSTAAFWRTTDAGLTWASMSITAAGSLGNLPDVEFSSTTAGYWIIGGNARYMVRGVGNASTSSPDMGGGTDSDAHYIVDGQDDDLIFSKGDGIWYMDSSNVQHISSSASGKPFSYRAPTERQLTSRELIACDQGLFGSHRGEVWYTSDYRAVDYSLITTVTNAGWVTTTLDGTVYLGGFNTLGGLTQVHQIDNIASSADESDVGPVTNGNERVGYIRSDRQTRTVVAARIIREATTSDLLVLTSAGWSRLAGPSSSGTTIADAVEVIVRG